MATFVSVVLVGRSYVECNQSNHAARVWIGIAGVLNLRTLLRTPPLLGACAKCRVKTSNCNRTAAG